MTKKNSERQSFYLTLWLTLKYSLSYRFLVVNILFSISLLTFRKTTIEISRVNELRFVGFWKCFLVHQNVKFLDVGEPFIKWIKKTRWKWTIDRSNPEIIIKMPLNRNKTSNVKLHNALTAIDEFLTKRISTGTNSRMKWLVPIHNSNFIILNNWAMIMF